MAILFAVYAMLQTCMGCVLLCGLWGSRNACDTGSGMIVIGEGKKDTFRLKPLLEWKSIDGMLCVCVCCVRVCECVSVCVCMCLCERDVDVLHTCMCINTLLCARFLFLRACGGEC